MDPFDGADGPRVSAARLRSHVACCIHLAGVRGATLLLLFGYRALADWMSPLP
jgi:hypothetical protein